MHDGKLPFPCAVLKLAWPTYFLSAEEGVEVLVSKLLLVLKRVSCSARLFLGRAAIPLSLGAPFQFGCQPIVQSKCMHILFYAHALYDMTHHNMTHRSIIFTSRVRVYISKPRWQDSKTNRQPSSRRRRTTLCLPLSATGNW